MARQEASFESKNDFAMKGFEGEYEISAQNWSGVPTCAALPGRRFWGDVLTARAELPANQYTVLIHYLQQRSQDFILR